MGKRLAGQRYLFGADIQLEKLEQMGDPFIEMNKVIDWEIFREPIEKSIRKPDYKKGGRPPWDVVLMFKITMLMSWYSLSYNQAEYQCNNRLDFMRFLGLEIGSKIPDENAIWDFKEDLKKNGLDRELFELFNRLLVDMGYKLDSGVMVDASFVEVPRRRVISEKDLKDADRLLENGAINVTLEETEEAIIVHADDTVTQHILDQTDFEARWTKKNNHSFFGYKDHAAVDKDTKFIADYAVTSAEVHDSKIFTEFINAQTCRVWADSAYMSGDILAWLKEINPAIEINICHRPYRNRPLTDAQKEENRLTSKIRARVEHVFGYMTNSMRGMFLYSIGMKRIRRDIGLMNLGYNIRRLCTLERQMA